MKLHFAAATDTGLVRAANQDSYCVDPEGRFFVVADGMGGHAGGQEASKIAADTILNHITTHWSSDATAAELLSEALLKANAAILADQQDHPERADMGTTAVVLLFRQEGGVEKTWCAHVGDSRLYRLRGDKLDQITEDHTWVSRAVKTGIITPEEARNHAWRHVLSQCLGRPDVTTIEIQEFGVEPGDRLLLCSDGLTEEVSDTKIGDYLKKIRACESAVSQLIDAAKDHGGRDNITAVLVSADMHE
jgi:PPM family protein phosphatase